MKTSEKLVLVDGGRVAICLALTLIVCLGLGIKLAQGQEDGARAKSLAVQECGLCRRIVSLSPAITETLYALGMGENVVGVTRFCRYPVEAQTNAIVGGFLDLNYEAILALKPGMVFASRELHEQLRDIARFGIQTKELEHRSVSGIINSIREIGDFCGCKQKAEKVALGLEEELQSVQRQFAGQSAVRTLIVIGDGNDSGSIKSLFVSGKDGFYDELLRYAGGLNAFSGGTVSIPSLSAEGLLSLDPEVIIEIEPGLDVANPMLRDQREKIARQRWQSIGHLRAVKEGRVYLIDADYAVIPGPRFGYLLKDFARLLHSGPNEHVAQ